jgi:hypothetical protein
MPVSKSCQTEAAQIEFLRKLVLPMVRHNHSHPLTQPSSIKIYYEMTATSKRPLIFESVAVIRIGIHPVEEEPDQHIIHVAPRVSRTTTFHEVPTRLKSCP